MREDECLVEFRFAKNDKYSLVNTLQIPEVIRCYNSWKVDAVEALCICLKRLAYPCRNRDMIQRFGRPVPQLCSMVNTVVNTIYSYSAHLLGDIDQPYLSPTNPKLYADAIHAKGAALESCWGFVDGTVRPICQPTKNLRVVYNGYKRVHAMKFQSVMPPNGLIANLFGPLEGHRHGSGLLAMSEV